MTPSDLPVQINHSLRIARRRARNRGAANLAQIAYFTDEVGNRLLERLIYIKHQPHTILNLGAGLNRHSEQLAQRYPGATIVEIDSTINILNRTPERNLAQKFRSLFKTKPVCICAEPGALPLAAQSMEMVWANLLDIADDAPRIIAEIKRVLKPGGLLMLATIGPDTLRELRTVFAMADDLPHIHGQIDMHDLGDMLVHEGFTTPVVDMEMLTLTYPDCSTLAHDLRAAGATFLDPRRRQTLTGKHRWQRAVAAYDAQRTNDLLPISIELIYVHAWRDAERKTKDGRQIIQFEKKLFHE